MLAHRWVAITLVPVFALLAPALGAQPAPGLERGYRLMYALDFTAADREFTELERADPHDPLAPVSRAANLLFGELDRLDILQAQLFRDNSTFTTPHPPAPDPAVRGRFDAFVRIADGRARARLASAPRDPDALFALTLEHGLRADYASLIEHRNLAALSSTREANRWATELLSIAPAYYDAYLATGISAYIVGSLPAPLRWMFRAAGYRADKDAGMRELALTAERGRLLAPFARILLAVASLRDHDEARARALLAGLARDFPSNPLFARELRRLGGRGD
jgi:hypothetical protein